MNKLLNILLFGALLIFPIAEIGRFQSGAISISINDLFVFAVGLIWLALNYRDLKSFKYKLQKPIGLFLLVGLVSLLLNIGQLNPLSFIASILYLLRWAIYGLIYFVVVTRDKKTLDKFTYFLLVPVILILSLGFVQFFFYQNLRNLYYLGWDEHLYRLFSSFLDPNFAGSYFTLSLLFVIFMIFKLLKTKGKIKIYMLSIIAVLNFVAVYLTYSRSALIMLFVSLISFLFLIKQKKLLLLFLIPLIIFIFISPKSFQTEGTNLLRTASSEARIGAAKSAIKIIQDYPVLGVGFNAYRYAQFRYGFVVGDKWETTHSGGGTDNSFLFILATTGIIGLISYLYLLLNTFKLGKEKLQTNYIGALLIASLIGVIINSLFINSLFFVYIMEWIWILAALTERS